MSNYLRQSMNAVAILGLVVVATPSWAQHEPSELDTSEATAYLGAWTLSLEIGDMTLTFVDMGGKLGATLESEQLSDPVTITDIAKTQEGLYLQFDSDFGSLNIAVAVTSEGLTGILTNDDGSFNAAFDGSRFASEGASLGEGDDPEAENRNRSRRGPNTTQITLAEKNVVIQYGDSATDGPDYGQIATAKDGDVIALTLSMATKLRTDTDLAFGDVQVKYANFAENYSGVYSLWLKKVGEGWHLIFNEKPDIWGTMYDPSEDIGEVALSYVKLDAETEKLEFELSNEGDDATLRIAWGEYVWSTHFSSAH